MAYTEASLHGEGELYLEAGGVSTQLLFESAEVPCGGGDIAGKAKGCGRCCKPLEMLLKPEIASVPENAFEKAKLCTQPKNFCLELALPVLFGGVGVPYDASS